jgi:hypothetical protein
VVTSRYNPDMPQESTSTSAVPHEPLQGLSVRSDDEAALRKAIDLAFDYRGDVTIIRRSDPTPIIGYVFDRRARPRMEESVLRVIPGDGNPRVAISYNDIAELRFTGRDTASGRSFETWMKKYVQKKLAGEEASIHAEPLDAE